MKKKQYKIIATIVVVMLMTTSFFVSIVNVKAENISSTPNGSQTGEEQIINKENANVNNFVEVDHPYCGIKLQEGINLEEKLNELKNNLLGSSTGGLDWFWMDFNPGGEPNRNGGLFESESWTVTKNVYKDDFDDTDNKVPEWTSSSTLYSSVRSDEDLDDGTTAKGAWCTAGGEEGGLFCPTEDSRGWAKCEKSFDLDNFVDTSQPGFSFVGTTDYVVDTAFFCDYKVYSNDFNDGNDHLYFNAYLDDNNREWPICYQYHTGEGDMPKNDGWCTNFWDPSYTGCTNPSQMFNDHMKNFIVDYTQGNTQYGYYLWTFMNLIGSQCNFNFKMRFEVYLRLSGDILDPEYIKFWVDHAGIKLWYWSDEAPFTPNNPTPSNGANGVSISTDLKWYGGDPDDYIIPIDKVTYKVYFGTSSSPPEVASVGPYNADNHGPFTWTPPNDLEYGKKYYWKIKAVDSFGLESTSSVWSFTTAPNNAPNTPSKPSGPETGKVNTDYTYKSTTTDPEGDNIYYLFNWGDGSDSGWLGPYTSGTEGSATHKWQDDTSYDVKVKAKDVKGGESEWSPVLTVSISNTPPNAPSIPSGTMNGNHGQEYCYSTSATDPELQQVRYCFDWGDGQTSWTDWVSSGSTGTKCHTWGSTGTYCVKAKTQDKAGGESGWSDCLMVNMGNGAPDIPYDPHPTHGASWVETNDVLSWKCNDPDGDSLKYDIYFGTSETPPLIKPNHDSKSYDPFGSNDMQPLTKYFWQIKAKDNHGGESISPVWNFTTRVHNPPVLSLYDGWITGCDKTSGKQSDDFTFRVHYYDVDKDCPSKAKLVVDKSKEFDMTKIGNDPCYDADYEVKLKGRDIGGGHHEYYFSYNDGHDTVRLPSQTTWSVDINQAPTAPTVSGPSDGKVKTEYCFTANSHDPEGEDLQYYFDWGDGSNTGWVPSEWVKNDESVTRCHTWGSMQTYQISVKARDTTGDESVCTTVSIKISRGGSAKTYFTNWLTILMQRFLYKFPILNKLFERFSLLKNYYLT